MTLEDQLREARRESMARKAMETMNVLLEYVDFEDPAQGAHDVVDVLEIWAQVLGGAIASIPGGDKSTWKEFMTPVQQNIALAYEARWDQDNGEG